MFTRFIFENEIVFALLKSDRLVSTTWFRVSDSLRNCCGRKGKKKKTAHRLVSSPERVQLQMLCGNSLAFSFQKKTMELFHYLELFAQVSFLIRVSWKRLSRAR